MALPFCCLPAACLALLLAVGPAFALSPASPKPDSPGPWSEIITDPFDGPVVHDRHAFDNRVLVTSWGTNGIRATLYTTTTFTEYRRVARSFQERTTDGKHYTVTRVVDEPVQRSFTTTAAPTEMFISLGERVYPYNSGPVPTALAAALVQAPDDNIRIRILLPTGESVDSLVGRATVATWRTLFIDAVAGASSEARVGPLNDPPALVGRTAQLADGWEVTIVRRRGNFVDFRYSYPAREIYDLTATYRRGSGFFSDENGRRIRGSDSEAYRRMREYLDSLP